jgi:hypothetical protein
VDRGATGDSARTIVEVEVTSRDGDPRFTAQMLHVLKEKRALIESLHRHQGVPAPSDPYERSRTQLERLSNEQLLQLDEFNQASLMNPQLFENITPEQLERWAVLVRSLKRMDDEPDRVR